VLIVVLFEKDKNKNDDDDDNNEICAWKYQISRRFWQNCHISRKFRGAYMHSFG